jgi:hypothetical protein
MKKQWFVTVFAATGILGASALAQNLPSGCYTYGSGPGVCSGDVGYTGDVAGNVSSQWRFQRVRVVGVGWDGDLELLILDGKNPPTRAKNYLWNFRFSKATDAYDRYRVGQIVTTGNQRPGLTGNWSQQRAQITGLSEEGVVRLRRLDGADAGQVAIHYLTTFGL